MITPTMNYDSKESTMKSIFKTRRFARLTAVLVIGVMSTSIGSAGDDLSSGRTVAMARTYTASSRGIDALGLNPANLALDDRGSTVTFQIPPFTGIGVLAGSDFINYKIYQDDFTGVDSLGADGQPALDKNGKAIRIGKTLSEADKQEILGLFPGGISHTQANFNITEFGLTVRSNTIGSFGLSVSDHAAINLDIPQGYLQTLLEAFPANGAVYSLDGTSVKASWTREFNLSYARMLPVKLGWAKNIAVGVGLKYVQGFAYLGTDHYTGAIQILPTYYPGNVLNTQAISGNVNFLQYMSGVNFDSTSSASEFLGKPAGRGMGVDLGFSAEVFPALRVAASLTDLGKITWSQNTKVITGNSNFTVADIGNKDSVKNYFKGEKYDTTSFKTSLPTAIHIGGELQVDKAPFVSYFPGQLLVAADLNVGFNNEPGNTTIPRFSIGTEYRPIGAFPIRTGITVGGRERFNWSLGFGINTPIWDLDLGTESIGLLTSPNSFHTGSITLGMRFRI